MFDPYKLFFHNQYSIFFHPLFIFIPTFFSTVMMIFFYPHFLSNVWMSFFTSTFFLYPSFFLAPLYFFIFYRYKSFVAMYLSPHFVFTNIGHCRTYFFPPHFLTTILFQLFWGIFLYPTFCSQLTINNK